MSFLCMWLYSFLYTIFLRDHHFPTGCSMLPYQILVVYIYMWMFNSGLSILFHCLFLYQYHAVLITIVLQYSLKSESVRCPVFVVVSHDCFGYLAILGSFMVPHKFQVCSIFYEKFHWNFDRDCVESIDSFGYYGHFNNMNSFNP